MVEVAAGDTLIRPGERISTVFLPDRGVVGVVNALATGQTAAIAAIGHEGLIGVTTVLNIPQAPAWGWAFVLVDAAGYALPSETFVRLFRDLSPLRELTLEHISRLIIDLARSAVCNRFHSHRQRLARWLIEVVRKSGQHSFPLTHDGIAQIVGEPRHAVTTALGELRASGAIECLRGHIHVIDEHRLYTFACECSDRRPPA